MGEGGRGGGLSGVEARVDYEPQKPIDTDIHYNASMWY